MTHLDQKPITKSPCSLNFKTYLKIDMMMSGFENFTHLNTQEKRKIWMAAVSLHIVTHYMILTYTQHECDVHIFADKLAHSSAFTRAHYKEVSPLTKPYQPSGGLGSEVQNLDSPTYIS